MKTISAFLLLTTVACSKDVELLERTVTPVGSQGGTARSADGHAALTFAPDVLEDNTKISMTTIRERPLSNLASMIYELGPDGMTFGEHPVTLTITVARGGRQLAIVNLDGPSPLIVSGGTWNPITKEAQAPLFHFSTYAVLDLDPSDDCDAGDDASCVRPDASPFDGPHPCDDPNAHCAPDGAITPDCDDPSAGCAPDGGAGGPADAPLFPIDSGDQTHPDGGVLGHPCDDPTAGCAPDGSVLDGGAFFGPDSARGHGSPLDGGSFSGLDAGFFGAPDADPVDAGP